MLSQSVAGAPRSPPDSRWLLPTIGQVQPMETVGHWYWQCSVAIIIVTVPGRALLPPSLRLPYEGACCACRAWRQRCKLDARQGTNRAAGLGRVIDSNHHQHLWTYLCDRSCLPTSPH